MSENVTSFFQLIGDSSLFDAAFSKAKAQAMEFAAGFKAAAGSVEADANRMGSSLERGLATGALSRNQVNSMISQRLQFYGGGGAAGATASGGLAMSGLGGLLGAVGIVTAILAPLGMLGDGLLRASEAYAQWSAQILRNSQAIGINAQDLQTWEKIANVAGLDQQMLTMSFERFGKNLAEGAPTLKATGYTLKDLGITTTDVGKSVLQLSDYFHAHSDQAQKAAIATALFGRSGVQLIPILDQGSQAFSNYRAELEKMGVVLSNSDLVTGAKAQVAIQHFSEAFEGAKNRLVGAALPGFTMFFQQLSQLLENNGQLWTLLGKVISEDVSFILGIIGGLTGQKFDFSKPLTDGAAAYEGLGGAAQDAAAGIGSAGAATKSLTAALDDQIQALQDEKRIQDDLYTAQKQALQDQLDSAKDVTDSRRHSGEDLVTYQRRLHELALNDQIKAVDRQKTNYDRSVDDHIAALNREKQAVKEAAGAMGASLSSGIGSGMQAGLKLADSAVLQINQKFVDMGTGLGKWLVTFFNNPSAALKEAADTFGQLLGSSIVKGAENKIGGDLFGWMGQHQPSSVHRPVPKFAAGGFTNEGLAYLHNDEVVLPMNDRSRSLALMEMSGMASLARGAGDGSGAAQGGGLTIQINGPMYAADPTEVARLMRAFQAEARRRGFALTGGFG